MYSEEKIKRINKIIKDMVFECDGEASIGISVKFDYQFQITGIKKMISVGEWYDFLVVDVTIIDGDQKFDVASKLMPDLITRDYRLLVHLDMSISDELVYFFDGSQPRINIRRGGVKLSDEYKERLESIDLTKPL